MRIRRFVLDLAIITLFTPFVWICAIPPHADAQGHPFYFLDPFLCLGLVVSGVTPSLLFAVLSVGILVLGRYVRLAFCRYLCPFGALQRLVWIRRIGEPCGQRLGVLPRLGPWVLVSGVLAATAGLLQLYTLDPLVLTSRGIQYLTSLFGPSGGGSPLLALPFFATIVAAIVIYLPFCRCLCPVKPVLAAIPNAKAKVPVRVSRTTRRIPVLRTRRLSRRQLLIGTSATALGVGACWWRLDRGSPAAPVLRPPGALAGRAFLGTCIRCGQCQSACPTGIIVPAGLESGSSGLLSPVLDFSRGFCPPGCFACQRVCPTGALARLTPSERRLYRIGIARSLPERCVRPSGKTCRLCLNVCPFQAISVGVPGQPNPPRVEAELCVGCGMCENACPVAKSQGGPAIRVYPRSDA